MAKKKAVNNEPVDMLDHIVQQVMEDSKNTWGDALCMGGEEETRVLCLPSPFALQLLFQLSGLPMGRFLMVVGPPGSCKSAFAYELGRLHRLPGGGYSLIETEDKDSASLRYSIVGYDRRRSLVIYTDSLEKWQMALYECINKVKEGLNSHKPPRSLPWCFIVDSAAGGTTAKIQEGVDSDGAGKLVQPHVANILSTWLKVAVHWLHPYPLSVVLVNHLKPSADQYGHLSKRNIQGGYAPRFHESIEIEMNALGKQQERREGRHEFFRQVQMRVAKNSLAQHSPTLQVEMFWYYEHAVPSDVTSPRIQRTQWDWQSAAIDYLLEPEIPSAGRKKVKEILGLQVVSKKDRLLWSTPLGIPEKQPVSFRQAGFLLEQQPELQKKLYSPLSIRQAFTFVPGRSIEVQRSEYLRQIVHIAGDLGNYGALPFLPATPQALPDPLLPEAGEEETNGVGGQS